MNIFIADDDSLSLEFLSRELRILCPKAQIFPFLRAEDLSAQIGRIACDAAFINFDMRGLNGLEAAYLLKQNNPDAGIVFLRSDASSFSEAFVACVPGRSVSAEDSTVSMRFALSHLHDLPELHPNESLSVKCFGEFTVFAREGLVPFAHPLDKEVFAYLIHRRGAFCTEQEIASALYGDMLHPLYLSEIYSGMKTALSRAGAQHILARSSAGIAVVPSRLDCDYYRFLSLEPVAVNAYHGKYLEPYSWAVLDTSSFARHTFAYAPAG